MNNLSIYASAVILALGASACKGYDSKKAEEERGRWVESLSDSISIVQKQHVSDSVRLADLQARIAEEISAFSTVSNPREVEPYYILKTFRSSYPLKSTGIAARVLKNEGLELVAALSGSQFNSIRIKTGDQMLETQTVPADQALNYTAGGLTTVAFTGSRADSLAMAVADNVSSEITLEYLQNGKICRSVSITPAQKKWIADTWHLCSSQMEVHALEKSMLLGSRKLQILRLTLDKELEKRRNAEKGE